MKRTYVYPKKQLNLTQLKTLADRIKSQDKTVTKVTFSAIPGDCLIVTREDLSQQN